MVSRYGELDKLHRRFFGIVVEGFHDVVGIIDHVQFFGSEGKESALEQDGEQDDEEGDVEDQVISR